MSNKAHITISLKYFNQRTEVENYKTLAYSFPPRPHESEGSNIVFYPDIELPLRKKGKVNHTDWQSLLCHMIILC